jgi:hypothetical protein
LTNVEIKNGIERNQINCSNIFVAFNEQIVLQERQIGALLDLVTEICISAEKQTGKKLVISRGGPEPVLDENNNRSMAFFIECQDKSNVH